MSWTVTPRAVTLAATLDMEIAQGLRPAMRGIGRTWGPASWEWRSLALHEAGSVVIAGQLFSDSRVDLRDRAGAEGCSSVRGGSVHRSGAVGAAFWN